MEAEAGEKEVEGRGRGGGEALEGGRETGGGEGEGGRVFATESHRSTIQIPRRVLRRIYFKV